MGELLTSLADAVVAAIYIYIHKSVTFKAKDRGKSEDSFFKENE